MERELPVEESVLLDAEALLLWYLYDIRLSKAQEAKLRETLAKIALAKKKGHADAE